MTEPIKPEPINMPPFSAWLASNIPAVYDNTMSYYDELTSLIAWLENEVVPNVNSAITLVNQLKDYVENYFKNLDVQEEINNKLDQMAEDGTLQEIITEYIQANVAWCFDSVADMKLAENFVNGSYAQTLGYNAKNDGGGSIYKIRTITNDDVVDEGAIIELADDTLIAELIYNDRINPEQYGCVGDGVTDDTVKFKKMINFAASKNIAIEASKIYLISEAITFGNINLYCKTATIKTNYGITINSATNKFLELPRVISSIANAQHAGITLYECYSCNVLETYIENFDTGLLLTADTHGCVYNTVTLTEIRNCLNSLKLENVSNGWVNQNTFIGGRLFNTSDFITNNGANIKLISLVGNSTHVINNNLFINTSIEGNEGSSNGVKIALSYATYNEFKMLRFEGSNPKIDSTNSNENILNGGYNVAGVTFVNDKVDIYNNGESVRVIKAGRTSGFYSDIQVAGNTYPVMQLRNSSGQLCAKINYDGLSCVNATYGTEALKINSNGISAFDQNQNNFIILRSYGKHSVLCNADGTNHTVCISPGTNTTNGCFLWVYDGHLYGKIGSQPSSASDGTVIL